MVKAKKYLGQHFLKNENIARMISDSLINKSNLPVIEIGPGTGMLTKQLINRGVDLYLVEVDDESVDFLNKTYKNKFNLIHADFLKLDLDNIISSEFVIIGNLPYNISSQIFFKMLDNIHKVQELVCMIQKEVAERIASPHGKKAYGILSVLMQLYCKIEYLFTVDEDEFIPPPKVKSAVIRFERYRTEIDDIDRNKLFLLVKTAFNQRRKTLRNSLKSIITETTDLSHPFFSLRPEQLSPEDFLLLAKLL